MINVLTVGHPRFDTRIWIKEITSLVNAGYRVKYHVADGDGNQTKNGVEIIDYGVIPSGCRIWYRIKRMFQVVTRSGLKRGDWVHFHDGIFVPFALLLALKGCRIIYDVHEDYPRQVLNSRFPRVIKVVWGKTLEGFEWFSNFTFMAYFTATPKIAERFSSEKTWIIHNFPILNELQAESSNQEDVKKDYFIYIGGLAEVRGVKEMVDAVGCAASINPRIMLALGGNYSPVSLRDELKNKEGWSYTQELGWLEREQVASWLSMGKAGLVTLHPTKNYPDAYPVKLFEYMSASLPVIASDFPLWNKIINEANCGILVDPLNPVAISEAMLWIMDNPEKAAQMGVSGRKAVVEHYNWKNEESKLIDVYKNLGVEKL